MRKWQHAAFELLPELSEYLPEKTIEKNRLCGLQYAIENIHYPQDRKKLMEAKYRLIFEELLFLQTGLLAIKRKMTAKEQGIRFSDAVSMDEFYLRAPVSADRRTEKSALGNQCGYGGSEGHEPACTGRRWLW